MMETESEQGVSFSNHAVPGSAFAISRNSKGTIINKKKSDISALNACNQIWLSFVNILLTAGSRKV